LNFFPRGSLEAGGTINDANGANVNLVGNDIVVQGAQVGNGDAIEINANNFAGRATAGNLNIVDLTGNITVTQLTTVKGNTPVTGINASDLFA
jgi:hypothetical protein